MFFLANIIFIFANEVYITAVGCRYVERSRKLKTLKI
jgi:hypothetical protein